MALMTARSFIFNGKSSEDYNMIIGAFQDIDFNSSNGMHRTVQKNDLNMSSKYTNTYGIIDDETITFTFSILRCNGERFSQAESLQINEWLLGPVTPQYLKFDISKSNKINYDEYDLHYYAICTSVEDEVQGGLVGKTVTFETNSSYGYMDTWKKTLTSTSAQSAKSNIFNPCVGDLSDYYPTLNITSNGVVTIRNTTTGQTCVYDFSNIQGKTLVVDNYHMKLKVDSKIIPMSKVGWTDDDIKWFYLSLGKNEIEISGDATVVLECEYPRKVGQL